MTHYARQTVAHNSITVGRKPLSLKGYKDRVLGVVMRGGQSPIQQPAWWKAWGIEKPQAVARPFREGRIVAYETSPLLDYAAGDATHSYPPQRVKSATRQFVYLRPDTFVVFDRVNPSADDLEVIWNLHALYEPAWSDQRRPDDSLPAERQFVIAPDGKTRESSPLPGGRFVHTGDGTFTIDDRWPSMTGRLFVRPLLPATNDRTIRTIGGPWHDFEVNGVNYGPTVETYGKHKGAANEHNRENSIGVGGWRIEISHDKPGGERQFLVVLHATEQTKAAMPPVECIALAGKAGARITVGPHVYDVTFATAGPLAGKVKVTEGGRTITRALAQTVQDHYGGWSSSSHFAAWRDRPEYRNSIGTLPAGAAEKERR
jgi:heparin/heparan-sulfate lyase